jgi:hypothetical protein
MTYSWQTILCQIILCEMWVTVSPTKKSRLSYHARTHTMILDMTSVMHWNWRRDGTEAVVAWKANSDVSEPIKATSFHHSASAVIYISLTNTPPCHDGTRCYSFHSLPTQSHTSCVFAFFFFLFFRVVQSQLSNDVSFWASVSLLTAYNVTWGLLWILLGDSCHCWLVLGSALHGDKCTAGCEAHRNFANESICLLADAVQNEVAAIHRSQEVLKILSLYTYTYFAINCFVKKTRVQQFFLRSRHTRHQLSLDGARLCELDVDSVKSSSDYFAYLWSLQVKPCFIRKECHLRIDLTFYDRL